MPPTTRRCWPGSGRRAPSTPRTPARLRPSSWSRCSRAPGACTSTAARPGGAPRAGPRARGARHPRRDRHRVPPHGTAVAGAGRGEPAGPADLVPDVLCVGKALTGGYLTLAAVLCTPRVAEGVSRGEAGGLMHGPTFMANPLACAIAAANLDLLAARDTAAEVARLENGLAGASARSIPGVRRGGSRARSRWRRPAPRAGAGGRGHGGGHRARGVAAAVPRPRLHDAAVRHVRRRPGADHGRPDRCRRGRARLSRVTRPWPRPSRASGRPASSRTPGGRARRRARPGSASTAGRCRPAPAQGRRPTARRCRAR